jgi:hypothetical protein
MAVTVPGSNPGNADSPYPTEKHLQRMAERSAAQDVKEAESMALDYAGWVMHEAAQKGYA